MDLSGIMGISLLKESRFTGSDNHICFMLEKWSKEEVTRLTAVVWPGSYYYDATSEEKKIAELLEFSEDGLRQIVVWMNE